MKWKGWIAGILGLWLIIELFIGFNQYDYSLIYFLIGMVMVGISLFTSRDNSWQVWFPVTLGSWLIIIAITPVLVSGIGIYINNIIVGLLMIVVGLSILIHEKNIIRNVKKVVKHLNFRNYGSE